MRRWCLTRYTKGKISLTRARADVASRQSDGPLRRGAPRGARGTRHPGAVDPMAAATAATPSTARGSAATSASAASRSGKPKASAHPSVEMALSGLGRVGGIAANPLSAGRVGGIVANPLLACGGEHGLFLTVCPYPAPPTVWADPNACRAPL
jgi:hypothetical protein